MPTILNREAYERLIDEDLEWLRQQPHALERDHIDVCLRWLRENKLHLDRFDRLKEHIDELTDRCNILRDERDQAIEYAKSDVQAEMAELRKELANRTRELSVARNGLRKIHITCCDSENPDDPTVNTVRLAAICALNDSVPIIESAPESFAAPVQGEG